MPSTEFNLTVSSVLPSDSIAATSVQGKEGLSQLYKFDVTLLVKAGQDAFKKLIGSELAVTVNFPGLPARCYTGIVTALEATGTHHDTSSYVATLRPSIWRLSRTRQSRIFQNKTVPDIIKSVLQGFNFEDILTKTYPEHTYCVQYEESDLAFCRRLMEEEGIYFYFDHQPQNEKLFLADDSVHSPDVPNASSLPYKPGSVTSAVPIVTDWTRVQSLRANKVTVRDHQFELPDQTLQANESGQKTITVGSEEFSISGPDIEQYEGSAGFAHRYDEIGQNGVEDASKLQGVFTDNSRTAQLRMDEITARTLREQGISNCPALCPGYSFQLTGDSSLQDHYTLLSVEHSIHVNESGEVDENYNYSNRFVTLPKSVVFRPRRKTPRPKIRGVHTAVVVGVEAEEITTDPYGRVKVKFYWDRSDTEGYKTSCWLRVATVWAGKNFGTTFIPRIGMEVLVSFVEGDPDQPLVVGCVPNPATPTHHKLPDNRRLSGLRTHTIRGDQTQFNELMFDDTKDGEYVNLHSQRNFYTQAEQTQVANVGSSYYMTVGVAQDAKDNPEEAKPSREPDKDADPRYQLYVDGFSLDTVSKYAADFVGYSKSDSRSDDEQNPQSLPLPIGKLTPLDLNTIVDNWQAANPEISGGPGDDASTDEVIEYWKTHDSSTAPTQIPDPTYTGIGIGTAGEDIGSGTEVGDYSQKIAGNKYLYTAKNHYESVADGRSLQVNGRNQTIVQGGQQLSIQGDRQTIVNGDDYQRVASGNQTIEVGGTQYITVMGDQVFHIHGEQHVHSTSDKWNINKSNSHSINYGNSTSYTYGDSYSETHGSSTSVTHGNSESETHGDSHYYMRGVNSTLVLGGAFTLVFGHGYSWVVAGWFQINVTIVAVQFNIITPLVYLGIQAGSKIALNTAPSITVNPAAKLKWTTVKAKATAIWTALTAVDEQVSVSEEQAAAVKTTVGMAVVE